MSFLKSLIKMKKTFSEGGWMCVFIIPRPCLTYEVTLQIYNFFQCLFQAQLKFSSDIDLPFPLTNYKIYCTQTSIFVTATRQEFFQGHPAGGWPFSVVQQAGLRWGGEGGQKSNTVPRGRFPLFLWHWVSNVPLFLPGSPWGEWTGCALSWREVPDCSPEQGQWGQ